MNKFWNINFNFAKKIKEDSINNEILSIKVLRIVSSLSTIESLKNMFLSLRDILVEFKTDESVECVVIN